MKERYDADAQTTKTIARIEKGGYVLSEHLHRRAQEAITEALWDAYNRGLTRRLRWRRVRTALVYAWVIGLGILGAEIIIEAQMISRQWELFDRTVKLLNLKAELTKGR